MHGHILSIFIPIKENPTVRKNATTEPAFRSERDSPSTRQQPNPTRLTFRKAEPTPPTLK